MKKIFTLAAVACVALSAQARQDLELFSPWGESCTLEGNTYTFNGTWAGAGLWLGTEPEEGVQVWYDASAYDYACIAYSNHTGGDLNFGVCYNHWEKEESWGDVFTTVSKKADMPEGYVFVKLDKESIADGGATYAEEIRQLQIQDAGAACTITIDAVAFITEEEYQEIIAGQAPVVKTKEFTIPEKYADGVVEMTEGENNAGWYDFGWIGSENLAEDGYKNFVIEIASAEAPFQVLAQNWPDGNQRVQAFEATATPIIVVYPIVAEVSEDETLKLTGLGQFALQNMNIEGEAWADPATGDMVSWYAANKVVVTRAYLTSEEEISVDGIKTIVVDNANGMTFNLAGQRAEAKGLVIKNGKVVYVK